MVVFAFVAAMAAGVNSDLAAAVAVTAAGILAIEVSGLAFGQSYGAQRYHVPVSYDTDGVPAALPPDATLALLRIAQEALVNAAKHAAGQPVAVRLDYGDADVRLTVRNDLPPDADTRRRRT